MIGPEGIASSGSRGGLGWKLGENSSQNGSYTFEQVAQGSGGVSILGGV